MALWCYLSPKTNIDEVRAAPWRRGVSGAALAAAATAAGLSFVRFYRRQVSTTRSFSLSSTSTTLRGPQATGLVQGNLGIT